MNRILFEKGEIEDGVATFGGVRAEHVLKVLHGEVGQILKTGEVNGLVGTGEILEIKGVGGEGTAETKGEILESARRGDAPVIRVRVSHTTPSLRPWVDLILAPPRPRVMKRLLPQLAAMGVGRIVLVGAKKVEKDFWGATLLREENYRPLLLDGLMQAGTSILPTLETRRNFRRFVTDELDALFPASRRIVAHPYAGNEAKAKGEGEEREAKAKGEGEGEAKAKGEGEGEAKARGEFQPLLLAIGPEGGWTDDEVELLEAHGFARYSLGPRILRTDTATIALLAKLNDEAVAKLVDAIVPIASKWRNPSLSDAFETNAST